MDHVIENLPPCRSVGASGRLMRVKSLHWPTFWSLHLAGKAVNLAALARMPLPQGPFLVAAV
jgi:hypothetical protein